MNNWHYLLLIASALVCVQVASALMSFQQTHGIPLSSDLRGYQTELSQELYAPIFPTLVKLVSPEYLVFLTFVALLVAVALVAGPWGSLAFLAFLYYPVVSQVVFGGNLAQAWAEILLLALFALPKWKWNFLFVLAAIPLHKFGFLTLAFAWIVMRVGSNPALFAGFIPYIEKLVNLPGELFHGLSLRIAFALPVWFIGLIGMKYLTVKQGLIVTSVFVTAFLGLALGYQPERVLAPVSLLLLAPASKALEESTAVLKVGVVVVMVGMALFAALQVHNDFLFYLTAFQG